SRASPPGWSVADARPDRRDRRLAQGGPQGSPSLVRLGERVEDRHRYHRGDVLLAAVAVLARFTAGAAGRCGTGLGAGGRAGLGPGSDAPVSAAEPGETVSAAGRPVMGPFQQVGDRVGEFFLGRTGPGAAGVVPGPLTERTGDAVQLPPEQRDPAAPPVVTDPHARHVVGIEAALPKALAAPGPRPLVSQRVEGVGC